MDHLSDCQLHRDDSNGRSFLLDLRKRILHVFSIAGFSHSPFFEITAPQQRHPVLLINGH
jgi:hypothetical protein